MKWHDEQEPENLGSGTYRLPLPLLSDGLRAVNVYLLAADNQLAVIDGGWAFEASRQAFAQGLRSLNAGFSDISRFLVTHAHADHYSQAIMLRREFGTRARWAWENEPSLPRLVPREPKAAIRCG